MDLWVKSLHVISVIAWMAGLLYLPRLFIYHTDAEAGSVQSETFKVMERRLMKAIMTPAMIATWVFGLWIATLYEVWNEPWFWVKFICVIVMSGIHMSYAKDLKAFAIDGNSKSQKYFRIMNEVPAVLMVVAVIMVIVKPSFF
ncbi:MAG: protoporphyrinogen oxidase HemJ [Pseudomonadota bacterium]